MESPDEEARVTVRMSKRLHDIVVTAAQHDKRTMNMQILFYIEQGAVGIEPDPAIVERAVRPGRPKKKSPATEEEPK